MTQNDLLADLLQRFEDARSAGRDVTPENLCREHPDLLDPFLDLLRQLGLLGGGVVEDPPEPPPIDAGRYTPTRFVGAGGLGVVYRATDGELGRTVALKWMKPLAAINSAARRRFQVEAEITGKLEHPGVAPVYGAGEDPDTQMPYYAMRFIEGRTLDDHIRAYHATPGEPAARRAEFTRLLRAFTAVCQTVAYAHSRGVVHRDIKPGNVMVGPYGETLLVDWGLAKEFDPAHPTDPTASGGAPIDLVPATAAETVASAQTVSGRAKGTPAYMPPEQAHGHWSLVGPASDVYSLGATLYTLLAGRPPYSEAKDKLAAVKAGPPRAARKVNPTAPRPLEAVAAKAMSRIPAERYATAQELAADVERWLTDEPVTAYRDPLFTRCRRWVKRHRVLTAAAAAAALVLVAALAVVAPVLTAKNRELEGQKNTIAGQADELAGKADQLEKQNVLIKAQKAEVETESEERRKKAEELADSLYDASVPRARLEWVSNNVRTAEGVLDGLDKVRRGWEWRYLKWLCQPKCRVLRDAIGCENVAASRDGKVIATSSLFQQVELRIKLDGKDYLTVPGTLALGEKEGYNWRVRIPAVVLAPDRKWVAATDSKRVKVWGVSDHKVLAEWEGEIDGLAVSPDGTTLAVGERKRIRLIDTKTWKEQASFATEAFANNHLVFDPKGKRLATTDFTTNSVRVWDVTTQKVTFTATTGRAVPGRAAFDPSGDLLAFGVGNAVEVYDLTAEWGPKQVVRPAQTFVGHTGRVRCVAFHPTKPLVVSGSDDGTINLWQPQLNEPVAILRGHTDPVHTLLFLDRGELLSAGTDNVRLWDAADDPDGFMRQGTDAAVSADGKYVATTGFGRRYPTDDSAKGVWLWDARTGELVREFNMGKDTSATFEHVALSPDGKYLAGGDRGIGGGSITVWEVGTGKVVRSIKGDDGFTKMAYRPDGKALVAASEPFALFDEKKPRPPVTLRFFDPATGDKLTTATLPSGQLNSLTFSPDGKTLAVAGGWGVRLLDGTTGKEVAKLTEAGVSVAFSPDGRYLLTTGIDAGRPEAGWIKVWDATTLEVAYTLRGHTQRVTAACMNEDGSRLFSVGEDGLVLVWNTATRREILRLQQGFGQRALHTVLYALGGDYLVTASGGGIFPGFTRIWPTATTPPK